MATASFSQGPVSRRTVPPLPALRRTVSLLVILSLSACSTDVLTPPERTGSVRPQANSQASSQAGTAAALRQERLTAYPPASGRVASTEAAATEAGPGTSPGTSPIPAEGVDIDAMVSAGPVVGLAEDQAREIAETRPDAPVVDGIGTNGVHALSVPERATEGRLPDSGPTGNRLADEGATGARAGGDPDLPPLTPAARAAETRRQAQFLEQEQRVAPRGRVSAAEEGAEQQVAFLPRAAPLSEPAASEGGRMPASEIACRQRLSKLGVSFAEVAPISSGPSCGIAHPISLSGLSGGIAVKPAVKLNCEVTEAFALWVRNELAPAARLRYLSGIGTIKPLGGYSCRTMNSRRGAAMSEHAHGNAIDVGKFVLKNGKAIDVRKPGFFAFREKGLLKAVRQDSCKYFNTVLGPGSDPFHKDHFHFDLRDRKSGYRHCD